MMFFNKPKQPETPLPKDIDNKSLKEQLADIKTLLNDPTKLEDFAKKSKEFTKFLSKSKDFKVPKKVIKKVKKEWKKNKIIICLLKTNRTIDFTVGQIVNGMIWLDKTPYNASVDFIFTHKGVPVIVVKEWDMIPVGTSDFYEAIKNKTTSVPGSILIRALEAKEAANLEKKKGMPMGILLIVGVIVAIVVAVYYFFGQKK